MMKRDRSKKAQITIFIILALIIVILIILFFLMRHPPEVEVLDEEDPQAYIESCTRDAVEEAISILSPLGGDIEPKGKILYKDEELVYHCYTDVLFEKCVSQRPMLIEHIEVEIDNFITPIVSDCFKNLESKLRKRYDLESSEMILDVRLYHKQIVVDIDKNMKFKRGDISKEFDHFRIDMVHPIYDFAKLAMEIVNQEIRYCNFDELGYMILYPEMDVKKFITGEADTIYVLEERASGEQFKFAVRNCKLPAGIEQQTFIEG